MQEREQNNEESCGRHVNSWVARWGFAVLVGAVTLAAVYVAWKVHVPPKVPDFALRAAPVYRIEVGAATFLGLYLVTVTFVLALNNRGFSEIGVTGLNAQAMANKAQQDAIQSHEKSLEILGAMVDEIEAWTEDSIRASQPRLDAVETAVSDQQRPTI